MANSSEIRKRLLFSAVAVVGFFLLAEIFLHLLPFSPPGRLLKAIGKQGEQRIYQICKDQKIIKPKPEGDFRIVVLGSSAANGTPFIGAGFPEQLQALLKLLHPERHFEVINFAQEGISTIFAQEYLKQALLLEPDLILVYLGNNEQLTYSWLNSSSHPLAFRVSLFLFLHSRILGLIYWGKGEILEAGLIMRVVSRYFGEEGWGPRRWTWERKVACRNNWIYNLEQMQKMAEKEKVPLIISTLSANRSEFPPIRSLHTQGLERELGRKVEQELGRVWEMRERGEGAQALEKVKALIALDPEYALSWFYLGRIQTEMGKISEAKASLEKAIVLSDFQQETTWEDNQALLENCKRKNLVCLDLNSHFDRISESGLAGFDLFMDHCHFNLEGSYQASLYFYQALAELGYLPRKESAELPRFNQLREHLPLSPEWEGRHYFNCGLILGHFFSRREFYRQAIFYLEKAVELKAFPGLSLLHQALIWLKNGQEAEALHSLSRAKREFPEQFQEAIRVKLPDVFFWEDNYLGVKVKEVVDWRGIYFRTGAPTSKAQPLLFSQADYYFEWHPSQGTFTNLTPELKDFLGATANKATTQLSLWDKNVSKLVQTHDLKPSSPRGNFKLLGKDPYLVFALPELKADQIKSLKIDFKIPWGKKSSLELYWRRAEEPFREERKISLTCKRRSCQISLLEHPLWLFSGPISQLRIDLPSGITNFQLKSLKLEVLPKTKN